MDSLSHMIVSSSLQSRESVYSASAPRERIKSKHCFRHTQITDLPDPILISIFSLVSDVRTRNCMALTSNDWYKLERATRLNLCLRGNICDLHLIPRCFRAVEALDLSVCSPWGFSLFQSSQAGLLIGQLMRQAFPNIKSLAVYVRDARDIDMVAYLWPELESIKLIRWHQRAMQPEEAAGLGMELRFLMQNCNKLKNVDLSDFYCWTEDIPQALEAGPVVASNLRSLNLLKLSPEGFKTAEIAAITGACRNLEELLMICVFDPRCLDFIADEGLLLIAKNCPNLRLLHLFDCNAFDHIRGDPHDGFASQDSPITREGLEGLFQSLELLEDLALVLLQNLRNAGPALDALSTHCKQLRSLRLGNFHSICIGPQLDGIALCYALTKLAIENCADLTDTGLEMIGRGCPRLCKLVLCSCKEISAVGLRACVQLLCRTLVDVEVSCCVLLDAASMLWALEPIHSSIQHLHIDCIWVKDFLKEKAKAESAYKMPITNAPESGFVSSCNTVPEGQSQFASKTGNIFNSSADMPVHDFISGVQCMGFDASQHSIRTPGNLDLGLSLGGTSNDFEGTISGSSQSDRSKYDVLLDGWHTSNSKGPSEYGHTDCTGVSVTGKWDNLITVRSGEDAKQKQAYVAELNCGLTNNNSIHKVEEEGMTFASTSDSQNQTFLKENLNLMTDVCCSTVHDDQFRDIKDSLKLSSNNHDLVNQSICTRNAKSIESSPALDMPGSLTLPGSLKVERYETSVDCSIYRSGVDFSLEGIPPCEDNDFSSFHTKCWSCLSSLSLWIPVGELIEPLPRMGLQFCPSLKEVTIKVQGDLRHCPKPNRRSCGLSALSSYPCLSKLVLDCSEAVGFALSAPAGHMDLSLWERWYLMGIQSLGISELDYWPPQDKEINQRGLTLPSAGLFSQCMNLRKLIVHGTAHEHFMLMLLRIPTLRDMQLRVDYYPAPDDELNTEMRTSSCKRIEVTLANRGFPD